MKKTGIFFVLLIVVSGFVVSTGCTSPDSSDCIPAITPSAPQQTVNATAKTIAPVNVTPRVIPVVKKNTTIVTPTASPDPVDVSEIRFVRYADNDFSLDYPSAWTVSDSHYDTYNCISTATKRCYQNELKTIGPFDFSDNEQLKKSSRIVTFTSADRKQKVVAFTSDFLDSLNGNYVLNPSQEWCQQLVTVNYPDVPGTVVSDYTYTMSGNTMTSSHTITMPKGSAAYPLAYTMKNFVTIHHNYRFAYISDTATLRKYQNLRDRILSSITLNDLA